ncbi:MAG: ABC transporter substrate-binding protein [Candidatus Heimdallarchaeaceae archaeon]
MKEKNRILTIIIVLVVLATANPNINKNINATNALNILVPPNDPLAYQYGVKIAEYLNPVFDKTVTVKEASLAEYNSALSGSLNFDFLITKVTNHAEDPLLFSRMLHDKIFKIIGMSPDIPYVNETEEILEELAVNTDLYYRQKQYYLWQQNIMDKILPFLPLFEQRLYSMYWSNLKGLNEAWGFVNSLPYLEFEGTHVGQTSITELKAFVILENNPESLLSDKIERFTPYLLVSEPIMSLDDIYQPLEGGLIDTTEMIDANTFIFHLKQGIYWAPSYNITGRDETSDPLDTSSTPLMVGLKGEISDGTNQEVTAKDAVFTILTKASEMANENANSYAWIKDVFVEPNDPYAFRIIVDSDPSTSSLEKYSAMYQQLSIPLLPEFFLNSTETTTVYTTSGKPFVGLYEGIKETPVWKAYSTMPFGCGKYILDYIKDNAYVFQKNVAWDTQLGEGIIDNTAQTLSINNITLKMIPSLTSEELSELEMGNADLIFNIKNFTLVSSYVNDDRFRISSTCKPESMYLLLFNLQSPLFLDAPKNTEFCSEPEKTNYTKGVAQRKAIAYSIDREKINREINNGEYLLADTPCYPSMTLWAYKSIVKYTYDTSKASEWMGAAEGNYNVKTNAIPLSIIGIWSGIFLATVSILYRKKR